MICDAGPVRPDGNGGVLGTPPAPITNTAAARGPDPHSAPRSDVNARIQKSEFLKIDGRVIDVCGSRPCYDARLDRALAQAAGSAGCARVGPSAFSTHSQ